MSSFVSAKGPSVTWTCPFLNPTLAPFEVGWSPAASTSTPALMSCSLYFPMVSRSFSDGSSPASDLLSAFTIIMNRTANLLSPDSRTRGGRIDRSAEIFGMSIRTPAIRQGNRRRYHDENQHVALDCAGPAGGVVSVCGWREARPAGRGDAAGSRRAAGPVPQVHRRVRELRGPRADSSVGAPDSAGPDASRRLRPGDHHDRRDRGHRARRPDRAGAVSVDCRG